MCSRLLLFFDINVSQGSVATFVRCGWIFNYGFIANLPLSLLVNKFWRLVSLWQSHGQKYSSPIFSGHGVFPSLPPISNTVYYKVTSGLRNSSRPRCSFSSSRSDLPPFSLKTPSPCLKIRSKSDRYFLRYDTVTRCWRADPDVSTPNTFAGLSFTVNREKAAPHRHYSGVNGNEALLRFAASLWWHHDNDVV